MSGLTGRGYFGAAVLVVAFALGIVQGGTAQELRNERLYERDGLRLTTVAILPIMASPSTRGLLGGDGATDRGFRQDVGTWLAHSMQTSSFYSHLQGLTPPDSSLSVLQRHGLTDEYLSLAQMYSRLGVVDSSVVGPVTGAFDSRYLLVPHLSYSGFAGEARLEGVIVDGQTGGIAWEGLAAASTEDWGSDVLTDGLMESFLASLPLPATSNFE